MARLGPPPALPACPSCSDMDPQMPIAHSTTHSTAHSTASSTARPTAASPRPPTPPGSDLDGKHATGRRPQAPSSTAGLGGRLAASLDAEAARRAPSAQSICDSAPSVPSDRERPLTERAGQVQLRPLPNPQHADFEYGIALGQRYLAAGRQREPLAQQLAMLLRRGLDPGRSPDSLPRLLCGFAHGLQLEQRKPAFVQALVSALLTQGKAAEATQPQLQSCLHALALARAPALHSPPMRVDYFAGEVRVGTQPREADGPAWQELPQEEASDICDREPSQPPGASALDTPPTELVGRGPLAAAWTNGLQGMYVEPLWAMSSPTSRAAPWAGTVPAPQAPSVEGSTPASVPSTDASSEEEEDAVGPTLERAQDDPEEEAEAPRLSRTGTPHPEADDGVGLGPDLATVGAADEEDHPVRFHPAPLASAARAAVSSAPAPLASTPTAADFMTPARMPVLLPDTSALARSIEKTLYMAARALSEEAEDAPQEEPSSATPAAPAAASARSPESALSPAARAVMDLIDQLHQELNASRPDRSNDSDSESEDPQSAGLSGPRPLARPRSLFADRSAPQSPDHGSPGPAWSPAPD